MASVLSKEEQERIHAHSLRLLFEVGVRFYSPTALNLLQTQGVLVDWDNKIARIPKEIVEYALQTTPKSFILGARNPAFSFGVPSHVTRFAMDGTAAFATDFKTGERRYGSQQDNIDSLRILQTLELAVMAWPPTCISEAPAESRPLHEFFTMVKSCSKHGQHELHTVEQVPYLAEGLLTVMGSEDAVRANNAYSLIYCPIPPLTHDGSMLDAYLELGQLGLPVMIMPMPSGGTTAPASLFSVIIQSNAEFLSALVVFQLAHPGRPILYSSATGSTNFKTGGFLGGTPEMSLQSTALVSMGRYYHLPTSTAGCTSDALQPGTEAVLEKIVTTLPAMLAAPDLIVGLGEIEGDQNLILEQIIVDHEIARLCQRLVHGIDSDQGKELIDDSIDVGPGGHFLLTDNTRKALRSGEFLESKLIPQYPYETWLQLGQPSLYNNARNKVIEILAGPMLDPLSDDLTRKLDDILTAADEKLVKD